MEKEEMKQLFAYLDNISKMLAFLIVQDEPTAKDKIIRLHKLGLSSSLIADALGTTRNSVDVTLSNARKAGEI